MRFPGVSSDGPNGGEKNNSESASTIGDDRIASPVPRKRRGANTSGGTFIGMRGAGTFAGRGGRCGLEGLGGLRRGRGLVGGRGVTGSGTVPSNSSSPYESGITKGSGVEVTVTSNGRLVAPSVPKGTLPP